jgi:hypothetical protein
VPKWSQERGGEGDEAQLRGSGIGEGSRRGIGAGIETQVVRWRAQLLRVESISQTLASASWEGGVKRDEAWERRGAAGTEGNGPGYGLGAQVAELYTWWLPSRPGCHNRRAKDKEKKKKKS